MVLRTYRPLFAASALLMALLGGITLAVFGGAEQPVSATTRYTVEVNEKGFNPRQCNIDRGDEVVFLNAGNGPIQVHSVPFGGQHPIFDQTLGVGETSSPLRYDAGSDFLYFAPKTPGVTEWPSGWTFTPAYGNTMTVSTPKTTNSGGGSCAKEAPTPTPTPTATITPVPTPTPPRPAKCTWNGCAVSLGLASDGQ